MRLFQEEWNVSWAVGASVFMHLIVVAALVAGEHFVPSRIPPLQETALGGGGFSVRLSPAGSASAAGGEAKQSAPNSPDAAKVSRSDVDATTAPRQTIASSAVAAHEVDSVAIKRRRIGTTQSVAKSTHARRRPTRELNVGSAIAAAGSRSDGNGRGAGLRGTGVSLNDGGGMAGGPGSAAGDGTGSGGRGNFQGVSGQGLPKPPYPANRPIQPTLITISCTIDDTGRFRDVTVETGDPQWNQSLRNFILRNWRVEPARLNGKPVQSVKKFELNWH
jgi:hypothetical protein